jgi:capsular polysaccharide transport system ATP-binding protein
VNDFVGIEFEDVTQVRRGQTQPILRNLNARFDARRSTAILGFESRPLRLMIDLITGGARLTSGRVRRNCSVSPPIAYAQGLGRYLTGRQNAAFLARIYGADMTATVEFVHRFSELGDVFDERMSSYAPEQRTRLFVALSYAIPFDMYLSAGTLIAGTGDFRKKCAAFVQELRSRSGILIATTSPQMVRTFCDTAFVLRDQTLIPFESIPDAIRYYKSADRKPIIEVEEIDDDEDEEPEEDYSII